MAVAAASILARSLFLKKMEELSQELVLNFLLERRPGNTSCRKNHPAGRARTPWPLRQTAFCQYKESQGIAPCLFSCSLTYDIIRGLCSTHHFREILMGRSFHE